MRNSFLTPIPEIDKALDYLSISADALLNEDLVSASSFLRLADMSEIARFYKRIAGKTDLSIHRQSFQPKDKLPKELRVESRMPSKKIEEMVFKRDGWRCRFCDKRVISRMTRRIFINRFPTETHWVSAEYERHTSLHSQAASLDHILPHSRGGDNAKTNLVTACGPCQFGRNCWTLEEVEFNDPRERQPIVDAWDGLTRMHHTPTQTT